MEFSTYFGTKEPVTSPFARSSNLFEAKPTTSETIGAYVQETFQGEGSLSQDIEAMNIRDSERQGRDKPISEESWKNSSYFRQGLTYHPNMTEYSAKTLSEIEDSRNNRKLIMDKASKLQTVAGFGVGFLSGIVEPKNLVSGVAAGLVTGGVGSLVPSVGRMIATTSVRGAATRGAIEGVVGAAATEPSNLESSKIVQGDYTMADSMVNLALGSILGAGLGGGLKHLELKGEAKVAAKKADLEVAYQTEARLAVKEFDTALAQITEGSAIDVHAVKQLDNAEKVQSAKQELPRIEEKIAATETPDSKILDKAMADVFYNNKVPEGIDSQILVDLASAKMPKKPETLLSFIKNNGGIKDDGGELKSIGIDSKTRPGLINNKAGNTLDEAALKAWEQGYFPEHQTRPDIDTLLTAIRDDYSGNRMVVRQSDYGYFNDIENFAQTDRAINELGIDAKKLRNFANKQKLQAKRVQVAAVAKIPVDNAPIKKLQDDVGKVDNSTAYDPKVSDEVQQYLDENQLDDIAALERHLESLQEDIQHMRDEGMLTAEQLAILDELNKIDGDINMRDNVLRSAHLCLTRG